MELIIEKPLNHQFNRRFFFLSFLMCFYCFNCFTTMAASAVKSMTGVDLEIGPDSDRYTKDNVMEGDTNSYSVSESEVQEIAAPDAEIDMEIEQWMYNSFTWKSTDSDKDIQLYLI